MNKPIDIDPFNFDFEDLKRMNKLYIHSSRLKIGLAYTLIALFLCIITYITYNKMIQFPNGIEMVCIIHDYRIDFLVSLSLTLLIGIIAIIVGMTSIHQFNQTEKYFEHKIMDHVQKIKDIESSNQ